MWPPICMGLWGDGEELKDVLDQIKEEMSA